MKQDAAQTSQQQTEHQHKTLLRLLSIIGAIGLYVFSVTRQNFAVRTTKQEVAPISQVKLDQDTLTDHQHENLLHIHHELVENIRFWRRLLIDLTLLLTSGMIGLCAFSVTRQKFTGHTVLIVTLLLLLLGWTGAFISRHIINHIKEHARIVTKIDDKLGLFTKDIYLKETSIYPAEWVSYGSENWREPVLSFCYWALIVIPMALSVLIAIVGLGA